MRAACICSGGALMLLSSPAAYAQQAGEGSQINIMGQLGQLALGLVLVVGLIFLIGYLMRRVGPLAPHGGQQIKLISSLALGPRDRLILVDVAGKQLLLGASPGRITTLHAFDEPVAEVPDRSGMNSEFAKTLRTLLKREPQP
ncbi:flagellar biosynthetic protein FliO [uncultured Halopseudomonas sp.]|uniref:flagellar biosynthetic protein FliO n=1 Tax=uncultured Halopseudomonas sp. TaxID=2901193 RepID=UPI0030ECB414|tara:strand:+ start:16635 stop:17063 length:429 start_codon:yes stop_codon:yes gene_type:complete